MIDKLFAKPLGTGSVVAGVCLIPTVWSFLADAARGTIAPSAGYPSLAVVAGLIIMGGLILVTPGCQVGSPEKLKKLSKSASDEFF